MTDFILATTCFILGLLLFYAQFRMNSLEFRIRQLEQKKLWTRSDN